MDLGMCTLRAGVDHVMEYRCNIPHTRFSKIVYGVVITSSCRDPVATGRCVGIVLS